MKYCSNCGNELNDDLKCPVCKSEFNNNLKTNNYIDNEKNSKKNKLAVAGFIISIISIFCCGFSSWLGLVFSIIGLCESKKYNGDGKSLAIIGIIISVIILSLWVVLYYIVILKNAIGNINNGGINTNLPFETMFIL